MDKINTLEKLEDKFSKDSIDKIVAEYVLLKKAKADKFDRIVAVMDSNLVEGDKISIIEKIISGED